MNWKITMTFSKIMALLILIAAFYLDLAVTKGGTITMFSMPFIVFLITGKQFIDKKK